MRLDEYLTGMRNCSDINLTGEFGVSPINVILLSSHLDEIEKHFISFEKLRLTSKNSDELFFDYVPGTVDIKVTSGVSSYALTNNFNLTDAEKEFYSNNLDEFNMSIILYPFQKKAIENVTKRRATALAIEDLCNLLIQKDMALCLPNSIGFNYLKPTKDLSRMVFHSHKNRSLLH